MISTATNTLQATANMTANPIRYHTNDVRSLMKNTLAGLEANSVTASGLGERRNGKFVLRGGGYLTPYSRSILSVHMGGDALAVPATLDPLFRGLFAEHWPFLAHLVHALDAHLDRAAAEAKTARGSATAAATSEPPLPLHVPRALDYGAFTVGGARGERRRLGYTAWRIQRPLSFYRSLELAPSRSMELASVNKWLDRLEVLEAFRAVSPRWRIERESKLPQRQEILSATRAHV